MRREELIGRDADVDAVRDGLASHRVVALTGPPGVGKSAVAHALAQTRSSLVCGLGESSTLEAITIELARALGTSSDASAIGRALAHRGKILVVLDDADRAAPALVKLVPRWLRELRERPGPCFLVTSRVRPRIAGERRIALGPLDVPDEDDRELDAIARSSAVRLFVKCAASVRHGYRLSAGSALAVAEIVRRLEGLPLGIELCASRVVVLSEKDIAGLLRDEVDMPLARADGRSLRGAFAVSWNALEPEDARVLSACASFRGSFDLDAATYVAGTDRKTDGAAKLAIASSLERLEEHSLVRAFEPESEPGARRYALAAAVRAFAEKELAARRDAGLVEAKFPEHFAAFEASPRDADALALDRQNLARALALAEKNGRWALAAQLLLAIAPLARAKGPLAPFLASADRVLAIKSVPKDRLAALLVARGLARVFIGRRDDAMEDFLRAERIAKTAKNLSFEGPRGRAPSSSPLLASRGREELRALEAAAASKIGLVLGFKGEIARSRRAFARALAQVPDHDRLARGIIHKDLANVLAERGDNDDAMIELGKARDLVHEAGDVREEGFVLMMLGSRLLDDGRLTDARRDLGRALDLLRRAGDRRSAAMAGVLTALVDAEEGDLGGARSRLESALQHFRTIGDGHTEGLVLAYLGNVAFEQGALDDAGTAYRDARVLLGDAGDRGMEAMTIAGAAAVDRACGRDAAARAGFAKAKKLALKDGRAARRDAITILASNGLDDPFTGDRPTEEIRFARRVTKATKKETSEELVVATDGSWVITPTGDVIRFGRAHALQRITHRLTVDRLRYPGRAVAPSVLVRAGWPDEKLLPASAKNRLHVTIARLRKSGLTVIHDEEGYFLDPKTKTRLAEAGERPPTVSGV